MQVTVRHGAAKWGSKWSYLAWEFARRGFDVHYDQRVEDYRLRTVKDLLGLILMEIEIDGASVRVWYDMAAFKRCYAQTVMIAGDLFFKNQTHPDHLKMKNVFYLPQVVFKVEYYYDVLERARKLKDKKQYQFDVIAMFKERSNPHRRKCIEVLRKRTDLKTMIAFWPKPMQPPIAELGKVGKVAYKDHLMLQAVSKISISVPGSGPKCYRDTESMGIGSCLFMLDTGFYYPPGHESCCVRFNPDFSDFEEKLDYYLQNDEPREKIASAGRNFFEKHLSPVRAVDLIMEKVKRRIDNEI